MDEPKETQDISSEEPEDTSEQDKAIKMVADRDFERIEKPEPFCIVTYKITPPFVDHCGIVMPDCLRFLHILKQHSAALQRLDHKILFPRQEGFYRQR